jgi:hypothetical protein
LDDRDAALTPKAPAIRADTDSLVKLPMIFATFGSKHLPDNGPIRGDFDQFIACRTESISIG